MSTLVKSGTPALWEPPKTEAARNELQSVLLNSTFPGAPPEMVSEVISYCAARQIDPLLKPVHIVPMWDRKQGRMVDTIMPGIYLYRILAARTGEYAGKSYPEWGPIRREILGGQNVAYPEWCRMTVYRRVNGALCEFGAEEWWLENYATRGKGSTAPNQMWAKRSRGQLAKCVEAQALRMAFPEAFGGTLTIEEMGGKMDAPTASDVIDAPTESEPPPKPTPKPLTDEERQRVENGANALIERLMSVVTRAELEAITSEPGVQKQRAFLRQRVPELAARVDYVVSETREVIERREQKEEQESNQSTAEVPADELEELPA